jgi:2-polyprenyl-3-methyl-5-hydroxy-6-metoxy-1,4-benzoquinol methylase
MIICPICNSNENYLLGLFKDTEYFTTNEQYKYYQCKKCKIVFISKFLENKLDLIYPKNYYSNFDKKSFISLLKKKIESILFKKIIIKNDLENLNVLDVGGGNGALLDSLKLLNIKLNELDVVDIDKSQKKICISKGYNFFQTKIEDFKTEKKYKLIFLVNIIEHVSDPKKILKKMRHLLDNNGVIFIKTPNTDNFFFKKFKKNYWGGYHCPRHWILFNKDNMENLLNSCGLTVQNFKYTQGGPQLRTLVFNYFIRKKFIKENKNLTHNFFYKLSLIFFVFIEIIRSLFFKTDQMILIVKKNDKKTLC